LQPRAMSASGNVPLAGEPDQAPIPTSPSAQATAPARPAEPASVPEPAHASAK